MLAVLPSQRLSSSALCDCKEIASNLTETCMKLDSNNKNFGLIETIKMPQKMKELNNRLPRPKYSRGRMRRMNSEPCRLPSVYSSRSRAGSASSRKQWDLEKPKQDKFIPRSVINSKKQQQDYHLKKESRNGGYFRNDSIQRAVIQRAASNIVSRGNHRRSIDIRRDASNESRGYEERKIPLQNQNINPSPRRQWGMPPINPKIPTKMNQPQAKYAKPPMAGMRPPLANIGVYMNKNNSNQTSNKNPFQQPPKNNKAARFGGIPRSNSPGMFGFQ